MHNIFITVFLNISLLTVLIFNQLIPIDLYLIPLALSGILAFNKLLEKSKSETALRDVFFYTWVVIYLSTFIAPIIHFSRDYWIEYVYLEPKSWNELALYVSSIYLYGIIVFYSLDRKNVYNKQSSNIWIFKSNASIIVISLMLLSFFLQTLFYVRIGWISGYIHAFSYQSVDSFKGMGTYFIASEMFPYLLLLLYLIKNQGKKASLSSIIIFLLLMLISTIYFGGLRGSRSNTVYTLLHAVILIHFTIYRFRRVHFIALSFAFFSFMIVGKWYKNAGIEVIQDFRKYDSGQIDSKMTSFETIIIGDLARFNIQSYGIYLMENNKSYKIKYGMTYFHSLLTYTPAGDKIKDFLELEGKSDALAQLQYDFDGVIRSNMRKNSRIMGFIGEFMLNFGVFSFVIAYFLLFYILSSLRGLTNSISTHDARFFIVSMIPFIIPLLINSDSDNFLLAMVKRIIPLSILLFLISNKVIRNPKHQNQ